MGFIFRPLDSGAARLRGDAERLSRKLTDRKGVANRIVGDYILRAAGDGRDIVVTAIPLNVSLGGAYMAQERTGANYPGSLTPETIGVGYVKVSSGTIKGAILGGSSSTAGSDYSSYLRYCASGRVQVGTVTQEWPLSGTPGGTNSGWLSSPPEFTPQGQCRFVRNGQPEAPPWTTSALTQKSAVITLASFLYREEYFDGGSSIATAQESAVTLLRCNARTNFLAIGNLGPDLPLPIKSDLQASYLSRASGLGGVGVIEFGWDALGIEVAPLVDDLDPSPDAGNITLNEGAVEPLGAFEWSSQAGLIAVRVINRGGDQRLVFLKYQLAQQPALSPGDPASIVATVAWRTDIAGRLRWINSGGFAQQNTGGIWATRAGSGVSSGLPDDPDAIIALSVDFPSLELVTDGVTFARLYTLGADTGALSTNLFYTFNHDWKNTAEAMERHDYYFAKGITLGLGVDARPALVCLKRVVPYYLSTTFEPDGMGGGTDVPVRVPRYSNGSAGNDISVVTLKHDGSIVALDVGANFIATYRPSDQYQGPLDAGYTEPRMLGFQALRGVASTTGAAAYGHPVCEFAPGYVAILVTPLATFTGQWSHRIAVCNAATGLKVYESADLSLPALAAGAFRGISCAQPGIINVIEGVESIAQHGTLLLSLTYPLVSGSANAATGCYATKDGGITLNRVLGAQLPAGVTMHYLGSPLAPAQIG